MSFFKNMFEDSNVESTQSKMDWVLLTNLNQLDEIVALSSEKPVLIFKHSTRCSISRMALKQFENEFNLPDKVTAYFLDLIQYREVSNEISKRFDVIHQSPQMLLIKEGKSVYATSHEDIDASHIPNLID
jgi:bacillithiol system protein YtxJ